MDLPFTALIVASGAASAAAGMVIARRAGVERQMYPGLLALLPCFYAAFASASGHHHISRLELAFGAPWIAVGLTCLVLELRRTAQILGVMWVLHAVFDLTHHLLVDNPGLPSWYPLWCAVVDVGVGACLLWFLPALAGASLRSTDPRDHASQPQ